MSRRISSSAGNLIAQCAYFLTLSFANDTCDVRVHYFT